MSSTETQIEVKKEEKQESKWYNPPMTRRGYLKLIIAGGATALAGYAGLNTYSSIVGKKPRVLGHLYVNYPEWFDTYGMTLNPTLGKYRSDDESTIRSQLEWGLQYDFDAFS